jgi:hypothetical protein
LLKNLTYNFKVVSGGITHLVSSFERPSGTTSTTTGPSGSASILVLFFLSPLLSFLSSFFYGFFHGTYLSFGVNTWNYFKIFDSKNFPECFKITSLNSASGRGYFIGSLY